ncbi:MAG: hypothetical protein LBT01_04870 [Spirochaetaceae bacterium]|jgi:hypothetical protein|nr:hypothetical protein [Spirochaetaceae bacterium]
METTQIVREINSLPLLQKMLVVEKVIYAIRKEEEKLSLEEGMDSLYDDYMNDKDLTAFAVLDSEGSSEFMNFNLGKGREENIKALLQFASANRKTVKNYAFNRGECYDK